MNMKIAELKGAALDWAVAKSEFPDLAVSHFVTWYGSCGGSYRYCTEWDQMGPILDREKISVNYDASGRFSKGWRAFSNKMPVTLGDTLLEAAARCYAGSRLGEDIDIPDEILALDLSAKIPEATVP